MMSGTSRAGTARWAAVGLGLLLLWTQVFIGVHELSHLGQIDSSACKFASIASTIGAGGTPAAPALLCTVPAAPDRGAAPERKLPGVRSHHQARAPPAVA